jgi:hypothetical protein
LAATIERKNWSGWLASRVGGRFNGFGPRRECFSFIPKHFPYNTKVENNSGKILRFLRNL